MAKAKELLTWYDTLDAEERESLHSLLADIEQAEKEKN